MQFELLNKSSNDYYNIQQTIFNNRGITDIKKFKKCDESLLNDYDLLCNINEAYDTYLYHIKQNNNICIIVDCDVDGYVSASMIYKHIKSINQELSVRYLLHSAKEHGLNDLIENIPDETNLVIVPDAGSNDVSSCRILKEKGIDVIVLDHHNIDIENPYAIIVNCQDGKYPNPDLCGAGVVFKFLQKYDDEFWTNYAENNIDIVALALIADMVNVISNENRYLIKQGIHNVKSTFFDTLIKKTYQFPSDYSVTDIQMKIVPVINGCIRAGSIEDKDVLFKAFADIDKDKTLIRTYRGKKYKENIYEKALRLAINAKNRQDSLVKKAIPFITSQIELENGIAICDLTDIPLKESKHYTGLIANKVANKYHKPCIVFNYNDTEDIYRGSGRNCNSSPIENFSKILSETGAFHLIQGHDNAFGISFKNKDKMTDVVNNIQLPNEYINKVDFIIPYELFDVKMLIDMVDANEYIGRGFPDIKVAITNVQVDAFEIMGKCDNNWKIISDEGIAYVNFDTCEDKLIELYNDNWEIPNSTRINIVGKPQINHYGGIVTPQIVVEDYEIVGC